MPITFTHIFILFIVIADSFTLYTSEPLDKNDQYHHAITKLNAIYKMWMRWLLLYLILEKKYIKYDENLNADARL